MERSTIKKINYNEAVCHFSNDLICPYCTFAQTIENEDGIPTNETHIHQCGQCKKHFAYSINEYSNDFYSLPLENQYVGDKERLMSVYGVDQESLLSADDIMQLINDLEHMRHLLVIDQLIEE